ncbi:hypothetical protein MANES_14G163466v8 [Manihot esculenta]|uniref:Uncharacterized protein n=1 Tax=Manihot esculenta TaxID=3983 RepID=A0ACB7GHJ8_MANES|nr:hypothetical protein MANES_14G163466v8 [Manihot esculenta]
MKSRQGFALMKQVIFNTLAVTREIELEIQFLRSSKPRVQSFGDGGPRWASSFELRIEPVTTYRPTSPLNASSPTNKTHYPALPAPKPPNRSSLIPKALPLSSSSNTKIPQNHHRNRPTRQYTHQEFFDLRAKGLCYKCKQPFSPTHKCLNKYLRAVIVGEDDEPQEEMEADAAILEPDSQAIVISDNAHFSKMELSLYSVGEISSPKTTKMQGKIENHTISIMVDSGASHNFVFGKMVSKLGLPMEDTSIFGVKLGDAHRVQSSGVCLSNKIDVGHLEIKADYFRFPLGVDLILGVTWLETLKEVRINWLIMKMIFSHSRRLVTIECNSAFTQASVCTN